MFITFHCFAVTDEFVSYVRTAVLNRLQRNIDNMSLICVFPFENVNEKTIIHWKSTIGVAVMVSMMLLSLFLMLFYGVKTVQTLRKVAMSAKTRTLQTQLMKALVFQVG
uniref:Col_cuticle_N domain-containing protein n=1 Tax=Angiostrongylus cantonensis TaxID=6313 RepID=A0A158PBE9_ANGCA